jgi:hypothetical protein
MRAIVGITQNTSHMAMPERTAEFRVGVQRGRSHAYNATAKLPTRKFDGIKVVQPVGFLPSAANAAVHCLSSSTRWNSSSSALMTTPAAIPPNTTRVKLGFIAPGRCQPGFISKDHAEREWFRGALLNSDAPGLARNQFTPACMPI